VTPERWQQIKEVLASVLEREPGERQDYLDKVCAEPMLRREVESLIAAHEQGDGSFMEDASTKSEALKSGAKLGPYEIVAPLGAGGMGVVYRARDQRLERDVALKVLAAGLLADESARRRFRKEALALAKLSHPNIAVIYDVGAEEGVDYLVMECVSGQSLAERLKSGPLPETEAAALGAQIAAALEEAHEHGVVHRDLKPGNVMLTAKGQAKVLDFGLAKLLASEETAEATETQWETREGAGTPPYMAPEQLRRESIDARADLWALGALLYEATTGQRPFCETLHSRLIDAILDQEPLAARALNPQLSSGMESVLKKALEKDRSRRYQTAAEMQADLDCLKQGRAPARSGAVRTVARRRGRLLAAVLGVLVIGGGLAAVTEVREPIRRWLGGKAIGQEKQLVVLPFEVTGGDPSAKAFGDGLTETLTAKLTQLTVNHALQVISASEVHAKRVTTAEEARQEFGVNLALEGNLSRSGARIRINYILVDTGTHRQLKADSITAAASDPFAVQDQVVNGALRMLELVAQPPELESLANHGTEVPGAYDFYLQGRGYLQDYDKTENLDSAITVFQRAIALDPNYALAHAGLGETYWQKYLASKDSQWVQSARHSCELALNAAGQLAAAFVCLGRLESGTGEYEKAVEEFGRAVAADPTSDDAYRGLADAYERLNKPAEAERTYRRAIELRPQYWAGYNFLGAFYYHQARYSEAASMFSQVVALAPDSFRGYSNLGTTYYYEGFYAEAIGALRRSIAIRPTDAAYSNLGSANFYLRHYDEAAKAYEEAVKLSPKDYILWWNLGDGYYWAPGKRPQAAQAYRQANLLASEALRVNRRNAYALGVLAYCDAMLGDQKRALDYLNEGLQMAPKDSEMRFKAALVYTQLGEVTQGLDWLKKSLDVGFSPTIVRDTPNFDALRLDPRFETLITAK
jgi:tetratricopeptide (TPR) repeat protein